MTAYRDALAVREELESELGLVRGLVAAEQAAIAELGGQWARVMGCVRPRVQRGRFIAGIAVGFFGVGALILLAAGLLLEGW